MKRAKRDRGWSYLVRRTVLSGALAAGIVILPLMATKGTAQETALTYTVLHSFANGADGGSPLAGLILDAAGNLYGTTANGGNTGSSCPLGSTGCGVVFKLDPAGNETVLYTFSGGADGGQPFAGLIRDTAGNLYGTTPIGGTYNGGVVFKLDPAANESVLYAFTGGADGSSPAAGLIRDAAGNLYGTTGYSGTYGWGVVFKLDPSGNETVLHAFTGGADGGGPRTGLIMDGAGNLYSTTYNGGASGCGGGCGVVFKLDPAGIETVLYTFTGGADGGNPQAGLIRDAAGTLYGTTIYGGNTSGSCAGFGGCGVVFKVDPSGKETVLYTFSGGADGSLPAAGLILDASGGLGGTTLSGGSHGDGVVFKVDQKGHETVLHAFTGEADGGGPLAGLVRDRTGNAYGTAGGGVYQWGVVFKLSPP